MPVSPLSRLSTCSEPSELDLHEGQARARPMAGGTPDVESQFTALPRRRSTSTSMAGRTGIPSHQLPVTTYALACALNGEGYSPAGLHAMVKAQDLRMAAIEDDAPQRQGNIGTNIDATEQESSQRAYVGHQLVVDARQAHPEWSNAQLGQYGTAVVREMWAGTCGPLNANIAHRAAEQMKDGDRVGLVDCPSSATNPVGHQIAVWHDHESGRTFNLDVWTDDPPHDPEHNVLTSQVAQPKAEQKFEYSKQDVSGALANIHDHAEALQEYSIQKQIDNQLKRMDGREPMGRIVQKTPSYISPDLMVQAKQKAQQQPELALSLARSITKEVASVDRPATEEDAQRAVEALGKF